MDKYKNYSIGIDEVGRGPLAGPVAVGVFLIKDSANSDFKKMFRGVKESKQLSEEKREKWFDIIEKALETGLVDFSVNFQSAKDIDLYGLTKTINTAMHLGLEEIVGTIAKITKKAKKVKNKNSENEVKKIHENCLVLLDGGLHASVHFKNQKTIIRGDEKKTVIALASICAKVLRDRHMKLQAKKYPLYDFDKHKGYGTKAHYAAIKKHGLTKIHRKSFLKKLDYERVRQKS